jgi:hypothetical protein
VRNYRVTQNPFSKPGIASVLHLASMTKSSFFPKEGGILTLWLCSTSIGLVFILSKGTSVIGFLYLAGSLSFLSSISTVQQLIRKRTAGQKFGVELFLPLIAGLTFWGIALLLVAHIEPILFFLAFLCVLALAGLQVMKRNASHWETRIAFAGAVSTIPLIALAISVGSYSPPAIFLIFAIPFAFFSAQELFVQHVIDTRRFLSNQSSNTQVIRKERIPRKLTLVCFLALYSICGMTTKFITGKIAITLSFEVLLLSFPILWYLTRDTKKLNFRTLGIEQASLDVFLALIVIIFCFSLT